MIIMKLQGGLGNQMFQYALGRRLSLDRKTPLLFDLSPFKIDHLRTYSLDCFVLSANIANPADVQRFSLFKRKEGGDIRSRLYNLLAARWNRYAKEKQFHFDPDVLKVSNDAYLEGYWTSEKYFDDIRQIILDDFRLREALSGKNKEVAHMMSSTESVSVHIRRGDYASDPETNSIFGTLDASYYAEAFKNLAKQVSNPELFVFSDDMEWVRRNLPLPFKATYIDWNGSMAHQDLRLMSLCKHHIIANSTFSWWGAWLGENPDKVVIGPTRWFKSQKKSVDTKDVLPESWIKI